MVTQRIGLTCLLWRNGSFRLCQDSTGTITIEIDNDEWRGQAIDSNDVVEISGEVEKEFRSVKIDVKVIQKIK